ncbi:MAG: hypothetical protein IT285_02170 [Bdellovibrionales bacterium]|nr:hypothetical protein [Bdellovibrionales bacterium]
MDRPGALSYPWPMRLVDFLVLVLQAHGRLLVDLKEIFGADLLLRILANYKPTELALQGSKLWELFPLKPRSSHSPFPFETLEKPVKEMRLNEDLEFFVWAYPYYRTFVESNVDLNETLPFQDQQVVLALAEEATSMARAWAEAVPLPPEAESELRSRAQEASRQHWVRFRSELFKRNGQSPFQRV